MDKKRAGFNPALHIAVKDVTGTTLPASLSLTSWPEVRALMQEASAMPLLLKEGSWGVPGIESS